MSGLSWVRKDAKLSQEPRLGEYSLEYLASHVSTSTKNKSPKQQNQFSEHLQQPSYPTLRASPAIALKTGPLLFIWGLPLLLKDLFFYWTPAGAPRTGPLLLNCFYFLMHYMHMYLRTSHYIIIYLNCNSKAPYLKIWLKIWIFKFKFKYEFCPNLTTLITNQKTHSNSSRHHYQRKRHMVLNHNITMNIKFLLRH
jgi:hypothetical protein